MIYDFGKDFACEIASAAGAEAAELKEKEFEQRLPRAGSEDLMHKCPML